MSPEKLLLTAFKSKCKNEPYSPRLISLLTIFSKYTPTPLSCVQRWEAEQGIALKYDNWAPIWDTKKICSLNVTAVEINYNVLLRWHMVPNWLAHVLPSNLFMFFGDARRLAYFCTFGGAIVHKLWVHLYRIPHTLLLEPAGRHLLVDTRTAAFSPGKHSATSR